MYKNILSSIPGIELYPIVALILFFGFFAALLFWYFVVDKQRMASLASEILDEGVPVRSNSHHVSNQGE